jgi:hypothetical protein
MEGDVELPPGEYAFTYEGGVEAWLALSEADRAPFLAADAVIISHFLEDEAPPARVGAIDVTAEMQRRGRALVEGWKRERAGEADEGVDLRFLFETLHGERVASRARQAPRPPCHAPMSTITTSK